MSDPTLVNRCPVCAELGETHAVIVEARTGLASCTEPHGHVWFVRGTHAVVRELSQESGAPTPRVPLRAVPDDEPYPRGPLNGGQ